MAKFLFLYRGGMSPETMTAEDRNASMNEWMNWFGAHGDALERPRDVSAPRRRTRRSPPYRRRTPSAR